MTPEARPPADPAASGPGEDGSAFSVLAMYPYEHLRAAWERLYAAVARDVDGAPAGLRWDLDVRDSWLSPKLAIGMTCGWPLVTRLEHSVTVVGTFEYAIDGAAGSTYRSVIVARDNAVPADPTGATLAFNSEESLSGWVSAIARLPAGQATWPGPVLETGGHLASVAAVVGGAADLASIDALTWAYLKRDAPEVLSGLVIVGRGPEVPHLPMIARLGTADDVLEAWRRGFSAATHDPTLAETLDTLLITGFVALDAQHYRAALAGLRRARP